MSESWVGYFSFVSDKIPLALIVKMWRPKHRIFRYLPFGLVLGVLTGCGGTEYRYASTQTSRVHNYLDANERIEEVSGLESVNLGTDGVLTGSIRRWGLMPEKSAPIVKNDTIQVTKANPVGASVLTLFTAGIYPILAPKDAWSTTVGKEQLARSDESPDYSKATKTGRSQWQLLRNQRQEKVTIRTGGAVIQRVISIGVNQTPALSLDLSSWIKEQTRLQGKAQIDFYVSCECRAAAAGVFPPSGIRDLKSEVQISISRNTHAALFPVETENLNRGARQSSPPSQNKPELLPRL